MPELPEVETIRRELEPLLTGRTVLGATVHRRDIVGFPGPAGLGRAIAGLRIATVARRGKYLLIRLRARTGPPRTLVVHLRLSGHLAVVPDTAPLLRFERIRFHLSGGQCLAFIEPRVLGRVYLVDEANLPPVLAGLDTLGIEPIESGFDAPYLRSRVRHRRTSIKALLLDQAIAAGIGNIYADEALFRAGIRPGRPGNRIRPGEFGRLVEALRGVLVESIANMGTTMRDARYQRPNHLPGGFQVLLRVFGREGQPCTVCGSTIQVSRIAGRTTRFCRQCQR
jgi:formamidopyrimidine-DNA glycosylase